MHIQETQTEKKLPSKEGRKSPGSKRGESGFCPEMEPGDGARTDGIFCDLEKKNRGWRDGSKSEG